MNAVSTAATQAIVASTGHKLRWWKAQPWWPSQAKMSRDLASERADIIVKVTGFSVMIPKDFSDVLNAALTNWTVVNDGPCLTLKHRTWNFNSFALPGFDEAAQALALLGVTTTQTEYDSQAGLRSEWIPSAW